MRLKRPTPSKRASARPLVGVLLAALLCVLLVWQGPPSASGSSSGSQGRRAQHSLAGGGPSRSEIEAAGHLAAATAKWASLTDAAVAAEGSSAESSIAVENEDEGPDLGAVIEHEFAAGRADGSAAPSHDGNSGGSGSADTQPSKNAMSSEVVVGSSSGSSGASGVANLTTPRCPPLTRELLQHAAKDNAIMFGLLNSAQIEFGLNWVKHVQHIGLSYSLVGALDSNTSALLASKKVHCFDYVDEAKSIQGALPNTQSQNFEWGKEGWRRVVWLKVFALKQIVDWGFHVVFSDVDVIWMRDPLPLLERHPHADMLWSTDVSKTDNKPGDDGLEVHGTMMTNFNAGVYLLRNTPRSVKWVHAWADMFKTWKGAIQPAAYNFTRTGATNPHGKDPRVRTAWNESIYWGIVPSFLFANGHTFLVQKLHEKIGTKPYAMHLTWTYSGAAGKRSRARDAMLWYDEEAYYSGPSFVTVDKLQVPQMPAGYNTWTHERNEEMVQFHLASIHSQLAQASVGMAMAVAFRRAFISPKFQCFCEKIWHAVNKCRMWEVQDEVFPIQCPTEYVFDPANFQDNPDKYGTPIDFREPSFLDNPRTPDAVKNSVLVIKPTASLGCTDCVREEKRPDGSLVLLVPPNLRAKYLLPLLTPYEKYRVWRLSFEGVQQPNQAFAGFACSGAAKRFDKRMGHITTYWCCRWRQEALQLNKPEKEQLHINSTYGLQPDLDAWC